MKELLETIARYADIPAGSRHEAPLTKELVKQLRGVVDDMQVDTVGNLYTVKKGKREGYILLAAHQDKIVESNYLCTIQGNDARGYCLDLYGIPAARSLQLVNQKRTFMIGTEHVQGELLLGRPHQTHAQSLLQDCMQLRVAYHAELEKAQETGSTSSYDLLGKEIYGLESDESMESNETPKTPSTYDLLESKTHELDLFMAENLRFACAQELEKGAIIIDWPLFSVNARGVVRGKLDDALGVGILQYLAKDASPDEMPTIVSLYTVQEEIGMKGAMHAVGALNGVKDQIGRIIVVDTTRFGAIGNGPVLYTSCGGLEFDARFINDFQIVIAKTNSPCTTLTPFSINDATVLAAGLDTIATTALEVPITNMHGALETTTVNDIVQTYQLLKAYLILGDITPLDNVRHAFREKDLLDSS
ncbi:hypothetical protein HY639_02550 [Candidatus Woesearchaeota archaeon]|nr:hypothetical protein [Candidatus Woesearchaeota archaeon]